MDRRCSGWPAAADDVLLQLDGDPPAAVRARCRKDRERFVRGPMVALLQDLADADDAYDDFTVEGFVSPDFGRWQHQHARIRLARSVTIELIFDLDGLRLSAQWWPREPEELWRYRAAVATEPSGPALAELLAERPGYRPVTEALLHRVPRGHAPDHPRAELLRHRSMATDLPLGCDDRLQTAAVVDLVLAAALELRPFTSWFAFHVARRPSGDG